MNGDRISNQVLNYVAANLFYVELESSLTACFTQCSGLGFTVSPKRFYEGGVNDQERLLIQPPKYTAVKLTRGITNSTIFLEWVSQAYGSGKQKRRNINILLFNQAGETMQCWTLIGAFPSGWKGPTLKAKANALAIEELSLLYEGLQFSRNSGSGVTLLNGRDSSGFYGSGLAYPQ